MLGLGMRCWHTSKCSRASPWSSGTPWIGHRDGRVTSSARVGASKMARPTCGGAREGHSEEIAKRPVMEIPSRLRALPATATCVSQGERPWPTRLHPLIDDKSVRRFKASDVERLARSWNRRNARLATRSSRGARLGAIEGRVRGARLSPCAWLRPETREATCDRSRRVAVFSSTLGSRRSDDLRGETPDDCPTA